MLTQNTLDSYTIWHAQAKELGGFALVDKPVGPTSFNIVHKLRRLTKIDRVGHAGTQDPLASGLLILAFGKATKQLEQFQGLPKSYLFTIKLGATTASFDAAQPEENLCDISHINSPAIEQLMPQFTGTISQLPPMYSAIKINGQRAYDAARKGQTIDLQPRPVMIHKLEIRAIDLPFVTFEVWCSKGTYVRSLARDIGATLGCGAYVTELRRTGIGLYSVQDAVGPTASFE